MTEKISELIDDRGPPDARQDLFDHIIADCGARQTWRRYHLIGCVLRGAAGAAGGDGADTCARIDSRLAAEPALRRRAWRTATKAGAAATLALAASLAVVAVIVFKPGATVDGGDGGGAVATVAGRAAVPPLATATCSPRPTMRN